MSTTAVSSMSGASSAALWLDSIALLKSPNPFAIRAAPFVCSRKADESELAQDEHELQEHIAHGDVSAKVILGTRYLAGHGVNAHPEKGRQWLLEAAQQGSRLAHIELGVYCLAGWGMQQDREQGLHWLRRIGALQPQQLSSLGLYLYLRSLTFPVAQRCQMAEEACELFNEAIRQGQREDVLNLVYLLRRGEIPAATYPPLDELLANHLQQGNALALVNEALRLARGVQCAIDWAAADTLMARVPDAESILSWWFARSLDGEAEGHLVVAWLCRHSLVVDPERHSLIARLDLARAGGWAVPEWMNRYPVNPPDALSS